MEQQLKERLVGAVVLVAAAVLFIPMILSGPGEGDAAPVADRAPVPEPTPPSHFSSRIVPLEQSGSASPSPAASPPQAEPPPAAPAAPPPAPAAVPSPAPALPRTAAEAPPAARSGWVVQLGSFSNARNAMALRDRLAASGYQAFTEASGSGPQAVTRVFVGPEPERERAERQVGRLLEETRLKGIVVRYPGE